MSRDYRLFLDDMVECCNKILRFTKDLSFEAFIADERTYDAVIRNLEVIGEAITHIPPEVQSNRPDIQWRKIKSLRDILIHEYFGIDQDIVWDIVTNKVASLLKELRKI